MSTNKRDALCVHTIGGPSAVLELGGHRLLTDPTFDGPGSYPIGGRALNKTHAAAMQPDQIGDVDAVLLSHDQHPDNLDRSGRAYLDGAPMVLTTASAVARLGGHAIELAPWKRIELHPPGRRALRVTGLPAQHGPAGTEHLTGEVRGFLLSGDGLPTTYVSGDNASLAVVRQIADRVGPVDVAVLFAGAARTPLLGDAYLTLTSAQAVEASRILGAAHVVPLHCEGWSHFTEGPDDLRAAFDRSELADRLVLLEPGGRAVLMPRQRTAWAARV